MRSAKFSPSECKRRQTVESFAKLTSATKTSVAEKKEIWQRKSTIFSVELKDMRVDKADILAHTNALFPSA